MYAIVSDRCTYRGTYSHKKGTFDIDIAKNKKCAVVGFFNSWLALIN